MRVLFVCTGNVCRSPLAEGYLKHLLQENHVTDVDVQSAGVSALAGCPPFDCALSVARDFNFDISQKRGCRLTPELIQNSDRIFCMESWQAQAVMQMEPRSVRKVALLGSFHPEGRPLFQISDPAKFEVPETLRAFELIKASVEGFFQSVAGQVRAS